MESICKKVDECKKVEALMSHDWATERQFVEAVETQCAECKERIK